MNEQEKATVDPPNWINGQTAAETADAAAPPKKARRPRRTKAQMAEARANEPASVARIVIPASEIPTLEFASMPDVQASTRIETVFIQPFFSNAVVALIASTALTVGIILGYIAH